MLLGYDKDGEIKFIFTDEKYLKTKYPNNTAKISNFWGTKNHGLTEFFISINTFKDWDNAKNYKIIDGKLTQKTNEEKKEVREYLPIEPNTIIIPPNKSMENSTMEIKPNN